VLLASDRIKQIAEELKITELAAFDIDLFARWWRYLPEEKQRAEVAARRARQAVWLKTLTQKQRAETFIKDPTRLAGR